MIRRLVNIVAERGSSGMYTLHRLDVSKHLFYPSSRAAIEAAKNKTNGKVPILPWLPAPVMRFEPSPTTLWDAGRLEMFALVSPRSCEDRILCSNTAGHTTLYNAYSNCVQAMPDLNSGKGFMPMAISIARPGAPEEDLYVMNTAADLGDGMCCFEVLRFGSLGGDDSEEEGPMREWTRAGGGWVLPFDGAAEYVPDLKLWMGFSSDSQQLCAWDLSAMDKPPSLRHSWIDLKTPEEWSASRLSLLNLGGGRFCIAKTFRVLSNTGVSFDSDSVEDKFAVLTGIEMVTSGVGRSDNGPEEGLKMVRHKSIRYMFTNEMIRWVL
ncbi:unnamed protein product [Urochloa decumbens]|uniref:Uncharacterized protein n=1 Tax=Urochloa decumbens TaxID=240449 RepID=A0ABC9FL65_9POAL